MTSMIGTRMFVYFTGAELAQALPFNRGEPIEEEIFSFVTILGEVTGETPGGVWFRPERMFDAHNSPLQVDLSDQPEYFLAWGSLRRGLLAKTKEVTAPPKQIGFRV